ncbi:ATP-binding protein [Peribacillus frigoritolerans]|nr:ATP-binding protein [Peribacillus frigoritolerans]
MGRELGSSSSWTNTQNWTASPLVWIITILFLIIGNLIENSFAALKHCSEETKQVYLSIYQDERHCQIVLEDNGPGIPEDIHKDIFEYGFTTKGAEGSGIGLYLIDQIVKKSERRNEIHDTP